MVSSDGFPVEAVLENGLRQYPDAEPNIDGWLDGEIGGEIELTKPLAVDLHQAKVKGASVVCSEGGSFCRRCSQPTDVRWTPV